MNNLVTRESLIALLNNEEKRQHVIGRALMVIFKNQTESEKSANQTTNHNNIGFTPADAKSGSITAKYYIKNKELLDWMTEKWMKPNDRGIPRIAKYWSQLNDAAITKRKIDNENA